MTTSRPGPILRLFEVTVAPGQMETLMEKVATTSAAVVSGEPGNLGYFFGRGMRQDESTVVFASLWDDLDAIKARFGAAWEESFLPEGYDALIETHRLRHIDLSGGWHA